MRKAVALALFLPMLGCSPIESAVLGGATGLWQKHEMLNLEKRVEYLERALKKERNCSHRLVLKPMVCQPSPVAATQL